MLAKATDGITQQNHVYVKRRKVKHTIILNKFVKKRLRIFGLIYGCVVVYGCVIITSQSMTLHQKEKQYLTLKKQEADLKAKKQNLETEIQNLHNDDYLLEIARRDYFFSKKGEVIFRIPNEK